MGPPLPYLFVYGTLQSMFRGNRYSRYLSREAELSGQAGLPGRLYTLRRYPGLRPPLAPDDLVNGELYRMRRPQEVLRVLDAYESRAYWRVLRWVTREGGETVRAWTYLFMRPLARHRRMESGAWPEGPMPHLVRKQRPRV